MFQCRRRGSYQNNHHKTIFSIEHYSRVLISYKVLLEVYQKNDVHIIKILHIKPNLCKQNYSMRYNNCLYFHVFEGVEFSVSS